MPCHWLKYLGRNAHGRASALAALLVLGSYVGLAIPASADHSGWSVPDILAKDDSADYAGSAGDPRLATDRDGNVIAVWLQVDTTGTSMVSNRYSVESGWGIAHAIETESGTAGAPQIAVDASGNAIAVWTNDPDAPDAQLPARVWANRYDAAVGWGTAELMGGSNNAVDPQIAMDPQGNGIASWVESDGRIWARHYVPGVGWGALALIELAATSSPQLAMDSEGNALAIWTKGDGNGFHVYASRFINGTGWGAPSMIDSTVSDSNNLPRLAMDPAGDAIAVWTKMKEDSSSQSVWGNRFVPGAGWGTAFLVATGGFDPAIAMNSPSQAIVAWNSWGIDGFGLRASRVTGGTWTAPVSLGGSVGGSPHPHVAIDSRGNAIVVWAGTSPSRPETRHLSANAYSTTGGWSGEIVFDQPASVYSPAVAVRPQGDGFVLWPQPLGIRSAMFASRYDFSAGWSTPVRVDGGASRDAYAPHIVAYGQGNAIAVWAQGDGTRYAIWANRHLEGVGWGAPSRLDIGTGDAVNPRVGTDPQGNAIVVWEQWLGVQLALRANRYVVGSGWGASVPIEGSDNGSDAQVAVDSFGNGIVIWRAWSGTSSAVRASHYEVGVGWSEAVEVGTLAPGAVPPRMAVNGAGNAVVVWAGNAGVWARRYGVGTGWELPNLIGPGGSGPQVDLNAAGNAIVVWDDGGIYANRFVTGSGWEGATFVASGNGSGRGYGRQIAMDSGGNAILVGTESNRGGLWGPSDVSASRYVVDRGWEPPVRVCCPDLASVGGPQTAFDPHGNAIVVWAGGSGVVAGVWANRFVVGMGWTGTTYVGGSEGIRWYEWASVELTVDSAGNAHTLWREHFGDRFIVWASQYTQHAVPPVPYDILQELALLRLISLAALVGLLASIVVFGVLLRMTWERLPHSVHHASDDLNPANLKDRLNEGVMPSTRNALAGAAGHLEQKRWPTQNAVANGVRLIAKERILLHLLHFARYADATEVPPELTQERTVEATGINRRHFAQYVRPLIQDGLVRERSAHVRGILQRRRVYVLTEEGRRKAIEIRDRIRSVVIRMKDASGEREATVAEALIEARGSMSILDILRESMETGVVDLRH